MVAKIELYNDSGDLVSKYEMPPCNIHTDYFFDYEVTKYDFRFQYAEYIPEFVTLKQKRGDKDEGLDD